MINKDKDQKFTPEETERRLIAALRGSRLVGHRPQSEMKVGEPKGKPPRVKRLKTEKKSDRSV